MLFIFVFQVNVWMFHDPYSVIGEDKPFKSGEPQHSQVFFFFLPGVRRRSRSLTQFLFPLQENVIKFLMVWTTEGRGKGNELLLFRTSGAGSEEPVRTCRISFSVSLGLTAPLWWWFLSLCCSWSSWTQTEKWTQVYRFVLQCFSLTLIIIIQLYMFIPTQFRPDVHEKTSKPNLTNKTACFSKTRKFLFVLHLRNSPGLTSDI